MASARSIVFAAKKARVDLVRGMPLAGVPLWPDCPQPELPHQPPDAPAADRNPLSQQRHLELTAAADRMIGENPVEPLQKLEFRRTVRPGPVIEAAARHRKQRALPAYGQPRIRRNHRPPLSNSGDGGLPGKKIALNLQLADLAVQIVDHLLRIFGRRCLAAARKQLARRASPAPVSSC
jgi:hypothetical protein